MKFSGFNSVGELNYDKDNVLNDGELGSAAAMMEKLLSVMDFRRMKPAHQMLEMVHQSVVDSVIMYAVVRWGSNFTSRESRLENSWGINCCPSWTIHYMTHRRNSRALLPKDCCKNDSGNHSSHQHFLIIHPRVTSDQISMLHYCPHIFHPSCNHTICTTHCIHCE